MNTRKLSNAELVLEGASGGQLTFGGLLEAIRLCDDFSQIDLAKKLHISPSHLCDIEKGRKIVSPERASKFARSLGYSEHLFVELALQAMLDKAGIEFKVKLA